MKLKHLLTKTLLAAAALCIGQNAWGDVTYDLVWEENIAKVCTDWNKGTTTTAGTVTLTDNGTYKNVSVEVDGNTHSFNTNLAISVGRTAQFMVRYAVSGSGYNAGFYYNWNASSTVAVLNVKKDQLVTIRTTSNTVLTATNATANAVSPTSYSHEFTLNGTKTITYYENVYTVTADGTVTFTIPNNIYVGYVSVKKEHVDGICEDPTYDITGANLNARSFTLACVTEGADIYYSTSELATADGGTLYSSEVETEATTIWAYAKSGALKSNVISFTTGAGSTLSLNTPTINATSFTNSDGSQVTNPTFNFACNNAAILGKPTATLSYTFTPAGGVESSATEGTSFAPTAYGTLKVTASASGYASSVKELVVSNRYTPSYIGRDYSTATTGDITATWGEAYSVTWEGWASGLTAYLASSISDDMHLNIQNDGTISLVPDWGLVRGDQKTYNYRVRYVKEGQFVAFKENTSKGADDTEIVYQTAYCPSGTGVITDLVTVTAPAGCALQQLTHYIPAPADVAITMANEYATYVNNTYDLDFSGTDIEAYTVKVATKGVATLTKQNQVKAGTPVLLIGSTDDIPVTTGVAAVADGSNDLVAGTGAALETVDGEYTNMILNSVGGNIGFYFANGKKVAEGKAYLHILTTVAPDRDTSAPMLMVFADGNETTGIEATMKSQQTKKNEAIYNLAGQRVSQPTKGLYIVGGKKVVVK